MSERRVRGLSRQSARSPRSVPRHTHDRTLTSTGSGDSVSVPTSGPAPRIPVRHVFEAEPNERNYKSQSQSRFDSQRSDGDIYLPPVLQDGWKGRDDVSDYLPYSPAPGGGRIGQVRNWPQHSQQPSSSSKRSTGASRSHIQTRPRPTGTIDDKPPAPVSLYDKYKNSKRTSRETGKRASDCIRLENVMERIEPRSHPRTRQATERTTATATATDIPIRSQARVKTNKYSISSDEERFQTDYRGMEDCETTNEEDSTTDQSRSTAIFSSGTEFTSGVSGSVFSDDPSQQNQLLDSFTSKSASYRHRDRLPVLSKTESESTMGESQHVSEKHPFSLTGPEDGRLIKTQQEWAYCTVFVTSVQLLILMLQLSMCSFAPFDVNPMIGPFPDQFSLWGGKNLYLMLQENQWWRMLTPAFLHVGVLHLAANFFCQLYVVAIFEREWGSFSWAFIFVMSEIGCSVASNYCDPNTIAVGSSGALMGIFGAKLAQVVTLSLFEAKSVDVDDVIRFDQLTSVLFGLTLVSMLGALTYIDWSGNMGGLATGFFAGIFIFSCTIYRCCGRFFWSLLGLAGLIGPVGYVMYLIVETSTPDEQLADVCEYFRSFFSEDYECGCPWK